MHHGRRLHDWGQTGSLLTMSANINRDPKRRRSPYPISAFVPSDVRSAFRTPRGIGLTRSTLHALKPLFQKEK